MNLITVIFGIFLGLCAILKPRRKQRAGQNERFVMIFLGFVLNVFSIIVLGDYNPAMFPDGSLQEDSAVYNFAYTIAYAIGTIC